MGWAWRWANVGFDIHQRGGADPPVHPLIVSCSSQGEGQVAHSTLGKVVQKEQRMIRW